MGKATSLRDLNTLSMCLGLVLIIVAIDWMVPAGVVIGILLAFPLLLASSTRSTSDVWIVLAAAMIGFVVAGIFGRAPISPPAVWLPNRILVLVVIPAAAILAAHLQQRRLEAEQSRDAAVASGDTNRLLFSLLAHDLRSPLVLSRQMFDYIRQCIDEDTTPDAGLLHELQLRLDRNLRVIDGVLAAARSEIDGADTQSSEPARTTLHAEIRQEIASFDAEADIRRKRVRATLGDEDHAIAVVDALVLRQVLGILLDNAIRYADPGDVNVAADVTADRVLHLRVHDPGSRAGVHMQPDGEGGAGLGLQLCRLLLSRAGGGLQLTSENGGATTVEALLPLTPLDTSGDAAS